MSLHVGYRKAPFRGIPKNIDETRTIEFIISSEKRDRHGTVLFYDRWELDNYHANPIVGYNHPFFSDDPKVTYDPDKLIGIGKVWKEPVNRLLIGSVTFEPGSINPLAEKLFQKIKNGTITSTSVGFIETKEGAFGKGEEGPNGKNPTYYYGGQELLEFSIVDMPSNTDAHLHSVAARSANKLGYNHFTNGFSVRDEGNLCSMHIEDMNEVELELEKMRIQLELEKSFDSKNLEAIKARNNLLYRFCLIEHIYNLKRK